MGGLLLGTAHCRPVSDKPTSKPGSIPSTATTTQDTTAGLAGTSWRLVKFEGGDGLTLTPDDKGKYTVAFGTDGRVSARIDCNRGSGTWTSSAPSQLEFGPLALTRAMCPPGSLHDRIVKHWPYFRSYVLKDGHLFLSLMADGGIYELEPAAQEDRTATKSPANTYWKLVQLGDTPVVVPPRQPEPHLILDAPTRRATGSGGCNRFSGGYTLSGDRLSFGSLAATLMACAEGMEMERAFMGALDRVRGWKITGQRLDLLDANGNVVARLEARQM
jgi:heat shock protein HslJ